MNGVREAFYNLRYRSAGERAAGGPGAAMRGQWVVLTVSMLVVFGCFFAVGRLMHTGSSVAPVAAAPSTQAGPSASAIPVRLSGASPIAGAVPAAIVVRPRPRHVARPVAGERRRSATVGGSSASEAGGEAPTSESQAASAPAPEPTPESTPTPSEAPAPARHSGGSERHGSAGGGSRSSGAVTFDSSE